MKILLLTSLFILYTAVLSQSDDEPTTEFSTATSSTAETTPTVTSSEVPTTSEVVTTTSSVVTSTSSEAPTSSSSPTTSSSAPTTSSSAPTTTQRTTSSVAPSSTTEAPVPTSSAVTPTKAPEPDKCLFNITASGITCIRAELKAKFIIDIQGIKHFINVGCNASYEGSECSSNETQTLKLSESMYQLTMIFEKEASTVFVRNITFNYNLPEGTGSVSNYSEKLFAVKSGNSYMCRSESNIHLENVTIEIYEIHIQAFEETNENFGTVEECEADEKVNDIVPIAVGVALGALIIIVLIAYLVGRRRSRQKGYQSV